MSDGRVFVAPYDDPLVIAGQGTVGAEVVRQLGPKIDSLHAIFVAVGGGGLIAGIAAYIKQLCPHVKVCTRGTTTCTTAIMHHIFRTPSCHGR